MEAPKIGSGESFEGEWEEVYGRIHGLVEKAEKICRKKYGTAFKAHDRIWGYAGKVLDELPGEEARDYAAWHALAGSGFKLKRESIKHGELPHPYEAEEFLKKLIDELEAMENKKE